MTENIEETSIHPPTSSGLPLAGNRSVDITLYIVITFMYWVSMYLYLPTLPTYINGKVHDLAIVGTVLSMFGLWQALGRLPVGIGADWLNWHKPFIIGGLIMSGAGAWILGHASGTEALIVGRTLTGLGASSWPVLVAGFSNLFPTDKVVRASAALTMIATIARMSSTTVTGTLNQFGGFGLAFMLATAISAFGILLMLAVNEPPRQRQRPSLQGFGHLITRRPVWLPSVLNALIQYVTWAAPFGFVPLLARQLGATETIQSLLLSLNLVASLVGSVFVTAARRFQSRYLVIFSFVLLFAGVGVVALATAMSDIFIGLILMGLSWGISYPVLIGLSIEKVKPEERATAMGLHQAVYASGMFAGPWLSGLLADAIGIQPMFGVTAVACLVIGLFGAKWLD